MPSDIGGRSNDGWILGDELVTWNDHDCHHQAFASLLNDQSRQIAKNLGILDPQGKSLAHRDRRCLSCHSSMPVDQMTLKGELVQEETSNNPLYTIGVSCEACHGPAGKRADGLEGWGSAHAKPFEQDDPKLWRTLSPQSKFEEFGYWDVHSPRSQSRICLSCHVGNVEQQKIITHEMYAAGHPPLPSFELSQFVQQMGRHWQRLDEKNKKVRDDFLDRRKRLQPAGGAGEFDPSDLAVTKTTMIAALVSLEESMQLTADLIDHSSAATQWPELANYACFACHHELQRDGWRRMRRLTTHPGRPTLHEWPFALSRAVTDTLERERNDFPFDAEIRGVMTALNSRPFGNGVELKAAATALARAAEVRSRELNSLAIHREQARDFLASIANVGSAELLDYDSARQLVWAYERTKSQLETPDRVEGIKYRLLPAAPKEWLGGNQDPAVLGLNLWLPDPANRIPMDKPVQLGVGTKKTQFAIDIGRVLKQSAAYDPEPVRDAFRKLRPLPSTDASAPK
ncbi:MAG: multiheme c-type cytochrome [Planctomycetota bacterium]